MPPTPIISVRSLGKRYLLRHEKQERYVALRDVLAEGLKNLGRTLLHPSKIRLKGSSPEEYWALKDVSFELEEGARVGIIGRNGAGKSTLLKLLSRVTEPTTGSISLRGRVASLLEVGSGFHPELTGRENIFLNGVILGMTRAEVRRAFDAIVDFAEIERFLDTPVKRYSSGMYMRLAFSVAAHLEPDILIVDEVLAVGDVEFQKKCMGKMQEVGRGTRTVIFVSHNFGAISSLCSECIRLDKGRIVQASKDVAAVIRGYLEETRGEEATVWKRVDDRFASPWFSPVQFSVFGLRNNKLPPFENDEEIVVEIEAEIAQLDPALTVGYAIYSMDGVCLYWSYQTDAAPLSWPQLKVGRNVLRSKLPRRLLNEGSYRIELIGSLHFRTWLLEPGKDVPTVFFSVSSVHSESPYWKVRRPTLLAPPTTWETSS